MTQLREQSCEACRADAPKLNAAQISALMAEVPGWQVIEPGGIAQLMREFSFANFAQALAFTQQVGELADSFDHHPVLITEWGKVTIYWWSHKIRGLHKNDFIMAAKTSALFMPGSD
ncbi:4a-hydroxytetrahydrobiopterin dehydratase [Gilvimarinus agarilyticus]|uniref:4a-hydroxytetrahydrobiopterin dehydratase n=1 Tax=unclassified Gilvimarinus TaxID=2642066 RepID=UPI001C09CD21|nr:MULTISPECIES: 4a-hydroxytetrahydrobiopterin dehydratase [unclassified Gilvimarinus]MBU2886906.1 4a-hydroxytetrahydrobiopterin dehydratase [Gilvimarinus agarilyticus]MDO6571567.1 4a-hydroxytetrahydrobiopterin dehydratase [Gilvimarinus sp. 2_MG-2023]MDO6747910.1 4a-hydroxytetrahydrobiopterin dehydratase [Gilvimarinus sp. 1_MG-2023]